MPQRLELRQIHVRKHEAAQDEKEVEQVDEALEDAAGAELRVRPTEVEDGDGDCRQTSEGVERKVPSQVRARGCLAALRLRRHLSSAPLPFVARCAPYVAAAERSAAGRN
jgi:hypothetical protein